MRKVNSIIKVCGWMVLIIVISINFNGCTKKQNPQSTEEQTEQFISKIQELREDPKKSSEYFKIIGKLAVLVRQEVEKNPEGMESFLEDMIEIAVKTSPGLALQVEDYANTELKKELEKNKEKVPVLLINDWPSDIVEAFVFVFINQTTKKRYSFTVKGPSGSEARSVIEIPPGDYEVEFYNIKSTRPFYTENFTISKKPIYYDPYSSTDCHGIVETPG